jgi:hypothetical protein
VTAIVIVIVIGTIVLSFAAPLVGALRGMTISIRPVVESHWESFAAGAFQLSIAERWLG